MEYSAIILAGGKSSRMGSDKSLVKINGKPMIEYAIGIAKGAKKIIISSSLESHTQLGFYCVQDDIENAGPLGGIYSGLMASKTQWNLVLATDTPFVSAKLLKRLMPKVTKADAVILKCNGNLHPLVGFYSKNIGSELKKYLLKGKRSVKGFLEHINALVVEVEPHYEPYLINVNTPAELNKINLMEVEVEYFGQLEELVGKRNDFLKVEKNTSLKDLLRNIEKDIPAIKNLSLNVAVNSSFEDREYKLKEKDKVAVMPPFAGG